MGKIDAPITDFFDDEPLLTIEKLVKGKIHAHLKVLRERIMSLGIKTAIITFVSNTSERAVELLKDAEPVHWVFGENSGRIPVYMYNGFLLVFTCVGSPNAAGIIENLSYFGIENFIAYGTAGCIDKNFDTNKMLVVERAIRDEGTSYHYLPPSVYVETDPVITEAIKYVFTKNKVKFECGTAWTTDALYRETGKRTAKRLEQGAVAVEMECAGFSAAAKRMGKRFGQFLFFSDRICEKAGWKWLKPSDTTGDVKVSLVPLAVEIAKEVEKL